MFGTVMAFLAIVAVVLLWVAIATAGIRRPNSTRYFVRVRQSTTNGNRLKHLVSAQIVDRRTGETLHFERVDMRKEGWEEELAVAVASVKSKCRHLEAATRIASEV